MNDTTPTHIVFGGDKIVISPNLSPIFHFLVNIQDEVETILSFGEQLQTIKEKFLEILGVTASFAKKLQENNIILDENLSFEAETIADNFKTLVPIRSQSIVLFANLEVIFCLYIAYEKEVSSEKEIIEHAMNNTEITNFIENYLFNKNNPHYQENEGVFSKIKSKDLRLLRNSLTHFFSVSPNIGIIRSGMETEARRIEGIIQGAGHTFINITPNDLFKLIGNSTILLLKERSNDCINDKSMFDRKIRHVHDIVKKHSPVILGKDDITKK